jgi:arginine decarboxylase
LGVMAEMPTLRQLVFILTFGNTKDDIERLVTALTKIAKNPGQDGELGQARVQVQGTAPTNHKGLAFVSQSSHQMSAFITNAKPQPPISPREAFFAKSDRVEFKLACDHISTEIICPYPPGIPVILPGEIITCEAIEFILAIKNAGGVVNGTSDPTLETIRVISNKKGS